MPLASRTGYKKMFEKLDWDYRGLLAEYREMKRETKREIKAPAGPTTTTPTRRPSAR